MLLYIIAGLVFGAIYALAAAGIVVTYVSTGVLNFAFASLAYFIARFYYFLLVQQHWGIIPSALVSLLLGAPALGVFLYLVLFRFLAQSSSLIKVVATIGLSVALPAVAVLLFSNVEITTAPGLAPQPVRVFEVLGVAVTLNQVIAYASVVFLLLIGVIVLRFTEAGLRVRAMVDSQAMTSISGTNPAWVAIGVWAVSIFLAGLAGVLAAPIISLDPTAFQLLIAGAFAAVVAAKLRNIAIAVAVGLAIGIVGALAQWALPPSSSLIQDIVPSIPFAFIVVFLGYGLIRRGGIDESVRVGGALDRAILPQGGHQSGTLGEEAAIDTDTSHVNRNALFDRGNVGAVVAVGIMAILPLILPTFWGQLVGQSMALAVIFLSISLVTGEGGMIWLCQITFAGVGAIAAAQLATNYHWPVLAAILVGGVIAAFMGAAIGLITLPLGNLYLALVTLTFALLMSTLVFTLNVFYQAGVGVAITPPGFASTPKSFDYFSIVVFVIIALIVFNVRRSTPGLALSAIRSSSAGSKSVGLSLVQMKVLVATLAAFVAGVGGGLFATYVGTATPDTYNVFVGLVWLAVLVTVGMRSNAAVIVAAASFIYLPAVFNAYLPISLGEVPTALFGLGAVLVARNPEGALAMNSRQIGSVVRKLRRGKSASMSPIAPNGHDAPGRVPATVSVFDEQL